MKLCFLGSADSPHMFRWLKYFVDKGHDVSLVTFDVPNMVPFFKGMKIKKLIAHDFLNPKNIIRVLFLINKLKKIINELNPDLIHAHQISALAYVIPFIRFHPYVLSAWGSDILVRPNKRLAKSYSTRGNKKIKSIAYSLLASYTINKSDLLHCDGITTWKALEKLGAPPDKIIRIGFGIDSGNFRPEKRSMEFRKKLGVGQSTTIISTRGLKPIYDVATLIKAIPKVISEIPDARFIIGGSGPMREELEELVKYFNIAKNTIFTGEISMEDMPCYVASSDVYVSTSLSDGGLASSTGEAMACGLPVVVTEDADIRDWIKDGINGFVIPVKRPDVLAARIIELIKDKNMRIKYGNINRNIIVERNDYNTEMGKMEREYIKLASK